jgi:hypothetical protein
MSNRSLVELNHDYWYMMKEPGFAEALQLYLASANAENAERLERFGVHVFGMRHHSEGFKIKWGHQEAGEPESRKA